jgi:DUF1009 family protein
VALAFPGDTDALLASEVDEIAWHPLGQLAAQIAFLHAHGVCDALLIGKIPKLHLVRDFARLAPDARALALLRDLRTRSDDGILGAIADELGREQIVLRRQTELLPEWVASEGVLGAVAPDDAQRADIAFAWPLARALGAVDVGQTVVVRDRAVMALEAIEGTDEAVRRGGALAGSGAVVLKVAKPRQDPRFDVPAVGPDTIAALVTGKAAVLAVEAFATLLVDREQLIAAADAAGIALVGVVEPPSAAAP